MTTGWLRDPNAGTGKGYLRAQAIPTPALTSPGTSGVGQTTATGSITTDQALGTLYSVVTASATRPAADQIRLGLDSVSAPALWAGSQAVSTTGAKSANATGLPNSATLYFHFAQFIGDVAATASTASFTTLAGNAITSVNSNNVVASNATGVVYAGNGFGASQGTGTIQWRLQGSSLVQAQTASAWNNVGVTANASLGSLPYTDVNHVIEAVITPQGGSALTRAFTLIPPTGQQAYPISAATASQAVGSLFNQLPFVPADGDQVVWPATIGSTALVPQTISGFSTGLIDSGPASGTFNATYWRASNQSWYDISATVGAGTVTPFTFTAQTGVTRGSTATSNTITLAGFTVAQAISIVGGTYSLNGGAYTAATGTANAGDTLTLRLTAAGAFNTLATATVTVGAYSTPFNVTSELADTTPDAFVFTPVSAAPLNQLFTSNAVTILGINAPASISVVGAQYSINGGPLTAAAGSISNGDTVSLTMTSASTVNTVSSATLTIGGGSSVWTISTFSGDTIPDQFTFVDQLNVPLSTLITSNTITVTGINVPSPITVTGGTYSINGAAFTSSPGTVVAGDQVAVRHTSSASLATQTDTALTIGGISDTFSSVTPAVDTTPDPFGFSPVVGAALSTVYTSEPQTIAGINSPAAITITGGTYSINGGGFTGSAGTVSNGDVVRVRAASSASFNTNIAVTPTIGGVSAVFNITTLAISLFVVD